jgi:flavin reductase (DIM6/NTAB) family NADH-FMN oxidoreductase RutF
MQNTSESIGAAMGKIPSGCFILTVRHEDRSTAVLVSWVQQASFEPLAVSVAIKKGRPAAALIDAAGCFALNVIGADPTAMFRHFAKGFSLEEDAFRGLHVQESDYGPLLEECIAHLGCRVTNTVNAGDHDIYIAHATAGQTRSGSQQPYTHTRKSGLTY